MRIVYDKLVRGKVFAHLRKMGIEFFGSVIGDFFGRNYYLRKKIVEEAGEVFAAETPAKLLEESADLTSIIRKLLEIHNFTKEDLERAIEEKDLEKGNFDDFHLLAWTNEPDK